MSGNHTLYFAIASYFQFWGKPVLKRWQPFIIAVTGSAGKTTLLSLIESILKPKIPVRISYKANSLTGIALDILKLKQKSFSPFEWLKLFIYAPFASRTNYKELVYVCELDSDRQHEMAKQTTLIKPDITCWTSAFATHTINFPGKEEAQILETLVSDFGNLLSVTRKLSLLNADSSLIYSQATKSKQPTGWISLDPKTKALLTLQDHQIGLNGTVAIFRLDLTMFEQLYRILQPAKKPTFDQSQISLTLPLAILSRLNMYGLGMAVLIGLLFDQPLDQIQERLKNWRLPPGRLGLFAGIKATTILDSSYNSSRLACEEALDVLITMKTSRSLAILGDMRELGPLEKSEHEALAKKISSLNIDRLILIGPAMNTHVLPILLDANSRLNETIFAYQHPRLALELISSTGFIKSGETILVKGSQNTLYLEAIVEHLLASQKDKHLLCRREKLWNDKRKLIYG